MSGFRLSSSAGASRVALRFCALVFLSVISRALDRVRSRVSGAAVRVLLSAWNRAQRRHNGSNTRRIAIRHAAVSNRRIGCDIHRLPSPAASTSPQHLVALRARHTQQRPRSAHAATTATQNDHRRGRRSSCSFLCFQRFTTRSRNRNGASILSDRTA